MRVLCVVLLVFACLRVSDAELGAAAANSQASKGRFLHETEVQEVRDDVEEAGKGEKHEGAAGKRRDRVIEEDEEGKEGQEAAEGEGGEEGKAGKEQGEEGEGGEEGEEHGEEREEEEEEEVEAEQVTGSIFLLGGVIFVMSLFYLVNHDDPDIKAHSWKVISATVSIFVAVLVFQGFNGVLDQAFDDVFGPEGNASSRAFGKIFMGYLQFTAYYCSMHVVLIEYAYWQFPVSSGVFKDVDDFLERRKLKLVAWSTLFAHVSGFTLIMCMLELMQLPVFNVSPTMTLIPVLLNALLLMGVFRLSEAIRQQESFTKDEHSHELWDEHAAETENDVAAISLSFGLVTVLRYLLTGVLANLLGLEMPLSEHSNAAKITVGVLAFVFAFLAVLILWAKSYFLKRRNLQEIERQQPAMKTTRGYARRWVEIASSISATCSSWCAMFSAKWILFHILKSYMKEVNPNECLERVLLAMIVTLLTIALVFALDWLKDQEETGEEADKAILMAINALAILVGFTWEKAFDSSVEVISELMSHGSSNPWKAVLARFALALGVSAVMVPAWRRHILKKALESDKEALQAGMPKE